MHRKLGKTKNNIREDAKKEKVKKYEISHTKPIMENFIPLFPFLFLSGVLAGHFPD